MDKFSSKGDASEDAYHFRIEDQFPGALTMEGFGHEESY